MVMEICPKCRKRIARQFYSTDYVHRCNSGRATIDTESVFKLGDWTGFSGSPEEKTGKVPNPMMQGLVNKLQGTLAGIEGEDAEPRNIHGKRKSTHRRRQRWTYSEFER